MIYQGVNTNPNWVLYRRERYETQNRRFASRKFALADPVPNSENTKQPIPPSTAIMTEVRMYMNPAVNTSTDVFLLWHTHPLTDGFGTHEEVKLIGVFSSEEKAQEAIEQLRNKEGFRDYPPQCFLIDRTGLDQTSWTDGFYIARWTEP